MLCCEVLANCLVSVLLRDTLLPGRNSVPREIYPVKVWPDSEFTSGPLMLMYLR